MTSNQCGNGVRSSAAIRQGGTVLEFFGCVVALAGGAVLGSMYLGIDVKKVAVTALQHAEIISPPADQEKPAVTAVDVSASDPAQAPSSAEGTATPVPAVEPAAAPATAFSDALTIPVAERQALTLAFWKSLDEVMKTELANRTAANQKSNDLKVYDYLTLRSQGPPQPAKRPSREPNTQRSKNWALYEYLTLRHQGHKAAAAAIAELSTRGVDGHVTAYAEKAHAWHEAGDELFARALDLLTDAPSAQLSGPFAQGWQSLATQHQMEERLLAEKHQAVQSYLDHGNHSDGGSTDSN